MDVALLDVPELHLEVKHNETMSVDAMVRQAVRDCGARVPAVVWKRNRGEWRIDLPARWFFDLLGRVSVDDS
jgi:hypothetical protein